MSGATPKCVVGLGYIARPRTSPAQPVVVLQELFVVNADIRKTCDEQQGADLCSVLRSCFNRPHWIRSPGANAPDNASACAQKCGTKHAQACRCSTSFAGIRSDELRSRFLQFCCKITKMDFPLLVHKAPWIHFDARHTPTQENDRQLER
jgi:hypothetical protein